MGSRVGIWRGIASAFADTLYEVAGFFMVRSDRDQSEGSTDLYVEGDHRWPTTGGRIVVNGISYTYSTLTASPTVCILHGILDYETGLIAGLQEDVREDTVVTFYGQNQTDLDLIRQAFFVETAEGADLDTLARNYGLSRQRGMTDSTLRSLLLVLLYLDATTIYSIEKVMDVLVGSGNYDVWDTPLDPDDHHKVFVELDLPVSATYKGKTFLAGHEAQASAGADVTVTYTPLVVYGVWASSDPYRTGTNHLMQTLTCSTNSASPDWLFGSPGTFQVSDEGRSVIIPATGEYWTILAFLSSSAVQLGRGSEGGSVIMGEPFTIYSDRLSFRSWMIGSELQVTQSDHAGNYQTGTISSVVSEREAVLTGIPGWAMSETNLEFRIKPDFGTASPVLVDLPRYSLSSKTITCPAALPANVLVDYASIPSAQLPLDATQDGVDQYPFYLFDDTWFVSNILDVITAAGVEPVVTRRS